jgi:hypothetical protein
VVAGFSVKVVWDTLAHVVTTKTYESSITQDPEQADSTLHT